MQRRANCKYYRSYLPNSGCHFTFNDVQVRSDLSGELEYSGHTIEVEKIDTIIGMELGAAGPKGLVGKQVAGERQMMTTGQKSGAIPIAIKKHGKRWYQGPKFEYRLKYPGKDKNVTVDVTRSAPRGNLALNAQMIQTLKEFFVGPGENVLDFGAGAWLRYITMINKTMSRRPLELYVVEYEEAFKNRSSGVQPVVTNLRKTFNQYAIFQTPEKFASRAKRGTCFDLILLINVLNTIPEEDHRAVIFRTLAKRLNPLGWLVVDQRIWVKSENPEAPKYGDGWIIEQPNYCTYRAGTGATWFNNMAREAKLVVFPLLIKHNAHNTFFRVWQKPF